MRKSSKNTAGKIRFERSGASTAPEVAYLRRGIFQSYVISICNINITSIHIIIRSMIPLVQVVPLELVQPPLVLLNLLVLY
jgi:hypothetical protein